MKVLVSVQRTGRKGRCFRYILFRVDGERRCSGRSVSNEKIFDKREKDCHPLWKRQ